MRVSFNSQAARWWGIAIVTLMLTSLGFAMAGSGASTHPAMTNAPPECPLPHTVRGGGLISTVEGAADAGPIADIPEFHDCQRMVEQNGKYGSLVAVYAKYQLTIAWTKLVKLDSIRRAARGRLEKWNDKRDSVRRATATRLTTGNTGTGVAIPSAGAMRGAGDVSWEVTRRILVVQSRQRALLFASVRGWDGGYPQLGVVEGWNCLFLYDTESANPSALMVNNGGNRDCAEIVPADTGGTGITKLQVTRVVVPGAKVRDYPPVARWEWDAGVGQQYIGIMCDAWCEVGPRVAAGATHTSALAYIETAAVVSTSAFSAAFSAPPVMTAPQRVAAIKGWFDEELLTPETSAKGSNPTGVRGTLLPHPELGTYTIAANFVSQQWVPVAEVALSGNSTLYGDKFGFFSDVARNSTPLDSRRLTTIELCLGAGCVPDDEVQGCLWPTEDPDQPTPPALAERWWARITAPGAASPVYKCVIRRPHDDGIDIPGTTRWRWMRDDQTVWVRCDQGCCEVIQ